VPLCWTVPAWQEIPGLRHGFFGREGGESGGAFASLNCSETVGDQIAAVHANRRRILRALGCDDLALPSQVHGDRVLEVGEGGTAGEADALLVRHRGLAAGVLTADCVPILLIAPEARQAAAVHAGWKGTALGITSLALRRLVEASGCSVQSVQAGIGPAIGACCYQVGEDVVRAIAAVAGVAVPAPRCDREGRSWIDLRAINAALLRAAGVPGEQVHLVGPCTRCAADRCFSHRGSGGRTGRQLCAVGWS
jgi:hypothetical protein